MKFMSVMEKQSFTRGEKVFNEGEESEAVFIVVKGEFELTKKMTQEGGQHTLKERLYEIKDFPTEHRVNIFDVGSLIAEEDVFQERPYQCTLKCNSQKGTVLRLKKEHFMTVQKESTNWRKVMTKIAYRDCRKDALDIHKLTEQEHLELNLENQ